MCFNSISVLYCKHISCLAALPPLQNYSIIVDSGQGLPIQLGCEITIGFKIIYFIPTVYHTARGIVLSYSYKLVRSEIISLSIVHFNIHKNSGPKTFRFCIFWLVMVSERESGGQSWVMNTTGSLVRSAGWPGWSLP